MRQRSLTERHFIFWRYMQVHIQRRICHRFEQRQRWPPRVIICFPGHKIMEGEKQENSSYSAGKVVATGVD
jgi:hypothetical protein